MNELPLLANIAFCCFLYSSPENVFTTSPVYCIKLQTQVNKLFRCLDSFLPDDNPGRLAPSTTSGWSHHCVYLLAAV